MDNSTNLKFEPWIFDISPYKHSSLIIHISMYQIKIEEDVTKIIVFWIEMRDKSNDTLYILRFSSNLRPVHRGKSYIYKAFL